MLASFVKGGAEFLKFVNDHTEKLGEKEEILSSGKSKVVAEILDKIGELHWVVGGLSIAAYLIEKCEKVSANKTEALELLSKMVDLATTVVKLRDVIPEDQERLKNAVMLVVQGSIMCFSQIESEKIFRFLKTSINSENLRDMSNTLDHLYRDLTLAISTATAKRLLQIANHQSILLSVPKPFYPKDAVGIEKAQEQVIKLLNMTSEDESTLAVVIYGFGGIGKTTLATSVVAMLDLKGYNFARVNLDEDKSKNDLKKKQEQILSDAFPNFQSGARIVLRDSQEAQHRLKEAFQSPDRNHVFLFIDNVLRFEDLKELLPEDLSDIPKRNRILLTTRRLDATDVIKGIRRHSFPMKTLDQNHAAEILCNDPHKCELIKDDMERILRICGGIPLALTIVRGHLVKMGYDADKCRQILDALEKGTSVKEENLSRRIVDFVYNELEESTKDAFLEICCFFNGWIRRHVEYIVGAQEVKSLEEAALVTSIVDDVPLGYQDMLKLTPFLMNEDPREIYAGEERLIVHDIVKAKGRTMSEREFTRFMDGESFSIAAQDEKTQQTKGIWFTNYSEQLSLEATQVDLMSRSLRVLSLNRRLNGRCERAFEELKFLDIPVQGDLLPIQLRKSRQLAFFHACFMKQNRTSEAKLTINLQLPQSLRLLYLDARFLSPVSLTINANLTSLRELQLINIAFENLETSIENFSCLKRLMLETVERLPDSFGNLSSLQTFTMGRRCNLKRLPESFGNLSSLQTLKMDYCDKLEGLPESFGNLSSLQTLDMVYSSNLERLPESFGNLYSLKTLSVDYTFKLEGLPENFGNLSSLQRLSMKRCSKMEVLPQSFVNLSSLQALYMDYCSMLEGLPENFGNLSSLKTLRMNSCSNLKRLPESFGSLSYLQTLNMLHCSELEGFPRSFGNLFSLKQLDMDNCSKLKGLPENFGNLSSLQTLAMFRCSNFEKLPESFGNLYSLKTLNMDYCSKLRGLPETFGSLPSLQTLSMDYCSELERLPESFGNISSLQTLRMNSCSNLKRLPESFGNIYSLETLGMDLCSNLEGLAESFGNLSSLQTLSMNSCSNLEGLPESFGNLSSLQTLSMDECSMLEGLPKGFGNLSSLQTLTMNSCSNLERLPESLNLSSLQTLSMDCCAQLKGLPESFGKLSSLQTLSMNCCYNLESLPESFGKLSSLQTLDMDLCKNLERLPESFGNLSSLQTFSMNSFANLEGLPESFGNLSSLQILSMDDCSKLQGLPKSFGNLFSVERLTMDGCKKMCRVCDNFGHLKCLKFLSIRNCEELKRFPEDIVCLTSLAAVKAYGCAELEEKAMDSFVEIRSLMFLEMGESPMLVKRWEEIQQHRPLTGAALRFEGGNYPYREIMSAMFFNGGSRLVHVDGDGQLAEVGSSSFPDVGVKVALLLTPCALSEKLRQKLVEVASREFQIIYVDVDEEAEGSSWMEEREKRIRETLMQLPQGSRVWTSSFSKTSLLFAYSLRKFTARVTTSMVGGGMLMDEAGRTVIGPPRKPKTEISYADTSVVGTNVVEDEDGRRKLSHPFEMIRDTDGFDSRRLDFETLFSPILKAWDLMRDENREVQATGEDEGMF